jgi:pimeloyl-ACP methyl ester carboxylesterase
MSASPHSRPDPGAFEIHRAEVRGRVELAYLREGVGGHPLLLVHGYPETKRIWWRNITALAAAGFEVIVPDLRGHGDSALADDGFYDVAAFSMDMHALVHDVLGHASCVAVGGDVGGPVIYDLGLRYPGFVVRQCIFNTVAPLIDDLYEEAGIPPDPAYEDRPTADYYLRQGRDADALLAELDTPERRRAWVATMYGHRLWAAPGNFTQVEIDFMTEPYADASKLRASWGVYETASLQREMEDMPRMLEQTPVPTLVLFGCEDHVIAPQFPARMAVACTECIGPFTIDNTGHFLQWEAADVLNQTLRYFCADLLTRTRG